MAELLSLVNLLTSCSGLIEHLGATWRLDPHQRQQLEKSLLCWIVVVVVVTDVIVIVVVVIQSSVDIDGRLKRGLVVDQ